MIRYADIDKVLEIINEVNADGGFTSYANYTYLFDAIDNMKSIKQYDWISCDDNVLPTGLEVNVSCCDNSGDTSLNYSVIGKK